MCILGGSLKFDKKYLLGRYQRIFLYQDHHKCLKYNLIYHNFYIGRKYSYSDLQIMMD